MIVDPVVVVMLVLTGIGVGRLIAVGRVDLCKRDWARGHAALTESRFVEAEGCFRSTLAFAEVSAVLDRMGREGQLTSVLVGSAREALADGPWRFMRAAPERTVIEALATKYALRGADLWRLR